MDWVVPLADLNFGIEEEEAVLDVIRRRWLTMGSITNEFEVAFAQYINVKYALAVSNATVALHLACLAAGIGPGDEVIVPSLTFVATANAVLYTGARVRFADILSKDELTISPEQIERQITPRTKAIIVVHYGGYPCRMEDICEIATRYGLFLIEDCAHAPGASLKGKALGTWGDIGCFSFFSNKNLSTGEGGMLVTNRKEIADKVKILRSHGMTTLTWDRHQGHAHSYDVVALGYNYRIDEIRSSLGLVQLKKLDQGNSMRKQWTKSYQVALEKTNIELPFKDNPSDAVSSYHLFPILLSEGINRARFIDLLKEARIQTSIHYPPIHQFQYYREIYPHITLPQTEAVAAREVTLPLYPTMGQKAVDQTVSAVYGALQSLSVSGSFANNKE
jgi:dTDP-4-amino-4,6-dideoxygalactose transaminase